MSVGLTSIKILVPFGKKEFKWLLFYKLPKSPEPKTKLQANEGKDGVGRGHELGKKGKREMEILNLFTHTSL